MWNLPDFGVDELETCGAAVRALGDGAETMEEAARRVVRALHEGFVDREGRRATALVRFYKTQRYGLLPPGLQAFARGAAEGEPLESGTPCLTLVATIGVEDAWCERQRSEGHQAIPLASSEAVQRLPMVARMLSDLGLDVADVVEPTGREALELHHRSYDVFFVPDARGSDSVPAQAGFVEPYGIRSVLGMGGALPSGDVFVVICFATVAITAAAADVLRSLAPAIKAAVIPVTYRVFDA